MTGRYERNRARREHTDVQLEKTGDLVIERPVHQPESDDSMAVIRLLDDLAVRYWHEDCAHCAELRVALVRWVRTHGRAEIG
jgi:hypothetical protein